MDMFYLFPPIRCGVSVCGSVLCRCLANGMDSTEQTMMLENAKR